MISLSRHIELLLLEHDCVIVPGLGGFIANHVEAQYNGDGDMLFLPPYRTIRFNQQLQVNDGLLVQSYMAAYDTSYPAAYLQMKRDIEKVIYELDVHGECIFEKIGVLRQGISRNIVFTPSEICTLTPSLYGLYSYEIKSLNNAIKDKEIEQALNTASAMAVNTNGDSPTGVSIHLHRRWIDFGISVAAAVVLLFCLSYQTLKNSESETDTVIAAFYSTDDAGDVARPSTKAKVAKPNKAIKVKDIDRAVVANKVTAEETEEKKADAETEKQEAKFAIVLASFVNKTNADAFIDNLSKQGFTEGRYVKNGNVSRILYSNYTDKENAQQALQELRQQCSEFADGWVLEL